jgi:hypothetical protein
VGVAVVVRGRSGAAYTSRAPCSNVICGRRRIVEKRVRLVVTKSAPRATMASRPRKAAGLRHWMGAKLRSVWRKPSGASAAKSSSSAERRRNGVGWDGKRLDEMRWEAEGRRTGYAPSTWTGYGDGHPRRGKSLRECATWVATGGLSQAKCGASPMFRTNSRATAATSRKRTGGHKQSSVLQRVCIRAPHKLGRQSCYR